jgi:hypothetical protein
MDMLTAARVEAVFTSSLSIDSRPTPAELTAVIREAVRFHGGTRACAGDVAFAYGERPETAAPRMRWARHVVQAAFTRRAASCAARAATTGVAGDTGGTRRETQCQQR